MISFVLDVAGKTQSSLPIPLHLSFRTDGGGRSFCSYGLRSDINEDHAEHGPAQAYVVKGTKCAIALVAQLDRASDHGSGGCRFESCQGHLGREAIPLPNRLPAPHASVA